MTEASTPQRRGYRLSPADRTGWLFGLGLAQLLVIGVTVVIATLLMVFASALAGLAVLAVGGLIGLARVHGEPLIEQLPQAVRFVRSFRRHGQTWFSSLPLPVAADDRAMPGALAGQDVLVVDAAEFGVGAPGRQVTVVRDSKTRSYAATLRVAGRPFRLMDGAEQDWLVGQWGTALQGFVSERPVVRQIRWSEWAAPAGVSEHQSWLDDQLADTPVLEVRASYDWLLSTAGRRATRHEVLVTLTVEPERAGKSSSARGRGRRDWTREGVELALSEARLFSERLGAAGLVVSGPLDPAELARALRVRLDPVCQAALDGRLRSLGQQSGTRRSRECCAARHSEPVDFVAG